MLLSIEFRTKKFVGAHVYLPPLSGAMGHCTKFNVQQLLFEAFSHILRIFGSIEPLTEFTLPFQNNIIFETYQSLEPSRSTLEEGRHVRPLLFLYRIQCSTTFI